MRLTTDCKEDIRSKEENKSTTDPGVQREMRQNKWIKSPKYSEEDPLEELEMSGEIREEGTRYVRKKSISNSTPIVAREFQEPLY